MPEIKVDITGETGQIKEAITEVKDAVRDASENIKKNAASAGDSVDSVAKKAAKNWKNAAKDMKSIGDKAKDSAGKISVAGGALSAMGASIGQKFGAVGQMISALASGPVGAIIAVIGASITGLTYMWDKLTISAEEAAMKTAAAVEQMKRKRQEAEQAFNDNSSYMERLKELSKQEKLSNEGKKEAATLIGIVQKRYGDLGLSIDKATGKLKGLDKAQEAFFEKSKKDRMKAAERQIKSLDKDTDAQLKIMQGGFFSRLANPSKLGDYNQYKKVRKLFKNMTGKQRLEYAEKAYSNAKTKADIENWKKILDILREREKVMEEYLSLKSKGAKDDKETAAAAKKKTEEKQKETDQEKQKQKAAADEEKPFATMEKSAKREAEYSALRLAKRERELAILQKIHALEDQKGRALTEEEKERVKKAVGAEFDIKQKEKQELEAARAAEEAKKAAAEEEKPFATMEKSAKREAEYSAMRLSKRERELAILQKIHDLEDQKGRALTEEEKERVKKAVGAEFDVRQKEKKELEAARAAEEAKKADAERTREFQQQLKLKQLEIQGLTKEAALQREIYALEKQKGRALTDAERAELSSRLAVIQALDAVGKRKQSALGYYAQFQQDSPYQNDQLIQMGAKVNAVTHTDWQAKNHEVLKTISKSVETIVQRANAPAGISNGGTFI